MIGSLQEFRDYAQERGHDAPTTATDDQARAALVRASDHIRFAYIRRFAAGHGETSANVAPATYEAALLELATPGFFAKTFTPGEQKVLTEAKGIKWQVLGDGANAGAAPVSTRVEDMLSGYMAQPVGLLTL